VERKCLPSNPVPELTTFRHPRSWTIGFAVGFPASVLAVVLLVAAAFRDGHALVAWFFLILGLSLLVPETWVLTHIAREIQVSKEAIWSKPYLGAPTTLAWAEIEAAESYAVFSFSLQRDVTTVFRLIADRGRSVAFTSRIEGFDELVSAIKDRSRALDAVASPPWWRRLVYRGFP
jgi:hypothetical protein